ncbi:hypothetical protein I4U23_017214 [Adineta vaga]|nr:hypothetical protein I4U23_017214 [Adineta vaga]
MTATTSAVATTTGLGTTATATATTTTTGQGQLKLQQQLQVVQNKGAFVCYAYIMRKQSQNYFIPLPTIQSSNYSIMQQPSTTTTISSSISMSTCTRATQTDDLSSTAELYQLTAHLHRLTGELVRACQAQNEAQQVTEMTMDVVVVPAAREY